MIVTLSLWGDYGVKMCVNHFLLCLAHIKYLQTNLVEINSLSACGNSCPHQVLINSFTLMHRVSADLLGKLLAFVLCLFVKLNICDKNIENCDKYLVTHHPALTILECLYPNLSNLTQICLCLFKELESTVLPCVILLLSWYLQNQLPVTVVVLVMVTL